MPLQGDLGSIPLADVIQLVAGARRTGALYVASPDDARVFAFKGGEIVSATSLEQRFRLGHALLRRGLLDPQSLEDALAAQRASPGKALGDVLLDRGAVTPESLRETLGDQAQIALDDVLHWQDGGFLFADAADEKEIVVPAGISFVVGPMLFESLRKLDEWSRYSDMLENANGVVEFNDAPDREPKSLPPGSSDALEIMEAIDGRRSIAMIRRKSPWAEHRVVRSLAILLEAGLIRIRSVPDTSKFAPSLWLDHARHLPVAPRAAGRAIALATVEAADAAEMHAAAMGDPGLAVAVLRAASSIGRAEGAQFSTLRDAVLALGDDVIRRVLVAAGLRGIYSKANRGFDLELWRHALVAAVAAARLSSRLGLPPDRAAEAYLCALLHDVGVFLLRATLAESYAKVDDLIATGRSRSDAERKLLGIGHEKVGARALEHWGAAPSVIESTLLHHAGARGDPWQLAVVIAADRIAAEAGWDAENLLQEGPSTVQVCDQTLGLSAADTRAVVQEVTDEAGGRDPLW
jgi:HD-like signal output (HDOD) protein